ncbi:MAG: hypothetical protein JWO43_488 [Candidatus Adlerbacteria bacterium]|nr:hypothetical protein [Candidatus Adlerbacteria bacterium]
MTPAQLREEAEAYEMTLRMMGPGWMPRGTAADILERVARDGCGGVFPTEVSAEDFALACHRLVINALGDEPADAFIATFIARNNERKKVIGKS